MIDSKNRAGEQLTPEAVERLEGVAKAAHPKTTNAWWFLGGGDYDLQVRDQTGSLLISVEIGGDDGGKDASALAAHIAAFDPPTVLALLSRIRADAERIKALEEALRLVKRYAFLATWPNDERVYNAVSDALTPTQERPA